MDQEFWDQYYASQAELTPGNGKPPPTVDIRAAVEAAHVPE